MDLSLPFPPSLSLSLKISGKNILRLVLCELFQQIVSRTMRVVPLQVLFADNLMLPLKGLLPFHQKAVFTDDNDDGH